MKPKIVKVEPPPLIITKIPNMTTTKKLWTKHTEQKELPR